MAQRSTRRAPLDQQLAVLRALPEERRVLIDRRPGTIPVRLIPSALLPFWTVLQQPEGLGSDRLAVLISVGDPRGDEVAGSECGLLLLRYAFDHGGRGDVVTDAQVPLVFLFTVRRDDR